MHVYDGDCECKSCTRQNTADKAVFSAEISRQNLGIQLLLDAAAAANISVSSEARAYLFREVRWSRTLPKQDEFLAWLRAK